MTKRLPMKDLAGRIDAHLRRFEADPSINTVRNRLSRFYLAHAFYAGGGYVGVVYVSYHGSTNMKRAEAEKYLAALDSGYTGLHWGIAGERAR